MFCGRIERAEERAGVVAEEVRHIAGRQPRLDEVVALASARVSLDLDRDARVLRFERGLQTFGGGDVRRIVVDVSK